MTDVEMKIEKLKRLMQIIKEDYPEVSSTGILYGFVFHAYAYGFPVNLIGYVAGRHEGTVYKCLHRFPIEYEKAKIERKEVLEKQKQKISGKAPEQNEKK